MGILGRRADAIAGVQRVRVPDFDDVLPLLVAVAQDREDRPAVRIELGGFLLLLRFRLVPQLGDWVGKCPLLPALAVGHGLVVVVVGERQIPQRLWTQEIMQSRSFSSSSSGSRLSMRPLIRRSQ